MENLNPKYYKKPKTLEEYLNLIIANRFYVILIAALIILYGFYKIINSNPVYQSTANVMISPNENANRILELRGGFSDQNIANQIEILNSRRLKSKLIISLWDSPLRDSLYIFGQGNQEESHNFINVFARNIVFPIKDGMKKLFNNSYEVVDVNGEYNKNIINGGLNSDPWNMEFPQKLPKGLDRKKLKNMVDNFHLKI